MQTVDSTNKPIPSGETFLYEDFTKYETRYPEGHTIADHWEVVSGDFTTGYGPFLKANETGELLYAGSPEPDVAESGKVNCAIRLGVIYDADLAFTVKTRRLDADNYLGFSIDFANDTVTVSEYIGGVPTDTLSVDYAFDSSRTFPYVIACGIFESRFLVGINGRIVIDAESSSLDSSLDPEPGFSLTVTAIGDNEVHFSFMHVIGIVAAADPSLANHPTMHYLAYHRTRLKQAIEDPETLDWDSYTLANRIQRRIMVRKPKDLLWRKRGYPIDGPYPELWFGN